MTMRENRPPHRFSNRCLACRKTLHCCWACRMTRCCLACKRIPRCCSVCMTIHRCCCCSTAPDETSRSWSGYTCCNNFYNPCCSSRNGSNLAGGTGNRKKIRLSTRSWSLICKNWGWRTVFSVKYNNKYLVAIST